MKLPPLRALEVFDAVAEHLSFSRAARRLHLSQSAVSHQIRRLEEYLGEPLFVREGRGVRLTEQGERFHERTAGALREIERAAAQVQGGHQEKVRLAVLSSFAVRWLIPRASELRQRHPELELELVMLSEVSRLSERVADCFITINPRQRGYSSELLYRERLFPVCSPKIWTQLQPALAGGSWVTPAEIAAHPLLSATSIFEERGEDWRRWFTACGAGDHLPERMQHFSHMLLAHEAATHDQGVALSNDYMLRPDEGSLVRLPGASFDTGDEFRLAFKTSRADDVGIRQLAGWLRDATRRSGLRSPP